MARLTNAQVEEASGSLLVDDAGPGAPLIISFGFYHPTVGSRFDFFGRVKKLEQLSGRPISQLLLRDPSLAWYQRGISGVADTVDGVAEALRPIIAQLKPSQVVTLGQSMGGYAALMFGALLSTDRAISFGPLSCFDSRLLALMNDFRWQSIVRQLEADPPKTCYRDLVPLLQAANAPTQYDIVYGSKPDHSNDGRDMLYADAAHAVRFYGISGVNLLPIGQCSHVVVEFLRSLDLLDGLLLQRLFGTPLQPPALVEGLSPEWLAWVATNLERGVTPDQIRTIFTEHQLGSDLAQRAIDRAHTETSLRALLES